MSIGFALALGALVACVWVLTDSTATPVPPAYGAGLPVSQLVALVRDGLRGLGDTHVTTALVVAAPKNPAENWLEPGAVPPSHPDRMVFVIVVEGRFICNSCSYPPGAKAPSGRSAQSIWVPGEGVTDAGLTRSTPRGLGKLGRVVTLRLVPPAVPAADLVLRPAIGIGPVRLGVGSDHLELAIGPAIQPGRWAFGPIEVYSQSARNGRIDRLAVVSPQATVDGHALGEGYARLGRELAGWRSRDCGHAERVLELDGPGGITTRLQFTGNTFNLAWIGTTSPATCLAPFPTG